MACFYFLYFYNMNKKCKWLVISKAFMQEHYKMQYEKLNELLGTDWYIYQYYTTYYLVVGECETSFISMKMELMF